LNTFEDTAVMPVIVFAAVALTGAARARAAPRRGIIARCIERCVAMGILQASLRGETGLQRTMRFRAAEGKRPSGGREAGAVEEKSAC